MTKRKTVTAAMTALLKELDELGAQYVACCFEIEAALKRKRQLAAKLQKTAAEIDERKKSKKKQSTEGKRRRVKEEQHDE
jgi:hypothetical protein